MPDMAMRSLLEPAAKMLGEQYAAIGILEEWGNTLELFNVALGFPNFNWTSEFLSLGEQNKVDDEAHRCARSSNDSRRFSGLNRLYCRDLSIVENVMKLLWIARWRVVSWS